jgi:hypothetical protein
MKNKLWVWVTTGFLLLLTGPVWAEPPRKVILVVFENASYKAAMDQPFFANFAHKGAVLTNYFAIRHPSQPNYLAMVSGSTFNVANNENTDINSNHLGDLLEAKGKSWHIYAEGFPGNCFLKDREKKYVRKHNPMISFVNVQTNPARCANITDSSGSSSFVHDFSTKLLADFSMYIPDLENDGHDTNVSFADKWFNRTFSPLLNDSSAMNGVMVVATFDEDDGTQANQVYTAFQGPDVTPGVRLDAHLNHYSLLRTIENLFSLGSLARDDATAHEIIGFLR